MLKMISKLSTTVGIIAAACGLTVLSLRYQHPANCTSYCWREPCQPDQCYNLKAGFPLFYIFDDSAGSPVSGWGKIGPEDLLNQPDLVAMFLNILFYSLGLLIAFKLLMLVKRHRMQRHR